MLISDVKVGDMIVPDGGFSCLAEGVPVEVKGNDDGDWYVVCGGASRTHSGNKHFLVGQMAGERLMGFTKGQPRAWPPQPPVNPLEDAGVRWMGSRNGFYVTPHEAYVQGFADGAIYAERKIPQAANAVALAVLEALIKVPATSNGAIAALKQAIHEIKQAAS